MRLDFNFKRILLISALRFLILNVPTLRFPGFEDEWKRKKIKDLLKIGSGRDYKHLQKGDVPVYGTGGYMTSVNQYLHDGETVCIGRKGTINKPFYHEGKIWTVDTLFYTHSFNGLTPRFGFNVFEKINWLQYNEASGVPSLSKSTIENIEVEIPSEAEQTKIAAFLEKIEERIATQNKIIEELKLLKSTLCNLLFRKKIRFRNEKGNSFPDWDNITMNDILIEVNDKSTRNNQFKILSSTAKGLFNQDEYFNREIASKDNIGYKILNRNQLVFSPQNLWMGNINVNIDFENGIVSPSYKIFAFKPNTTAMYCHYYLKQPELLFEYEQASVQGASIVRRNLEMDKFLQIEITLPSVEEQSRIAKIISSIEQKMKLEIDFCQLLTNQKKYLLKHLIK